MNKTAVRLGFLMLLFLLESKTPPEENKWDTVSMHLHETDLLKDGYLETNRPSVILKYMATFHEVIGAAKLQRSMLYVPMQTLAFNESTRFKEDVTELALCFSLAQMFLISRLFLFSECVQHEQPFASF